MTDPTPPAPSEAEIEQMLWLMEQNDTLTAKLAAAEAERDDLKLAISEYFAPHSPPDHFAEFFGATHD